MSSVNSQVSFNESLMTARLVTQPANAVDSEPTVRGKSSEGTRLFGHSGFKSPWLHLPFIPSSPPDSAFVQVKSLPCVKQTRSLLQEHRSESKVLCVRVGGWGLKCTTPLVVANPP